MDTIVLECYFELHECLYKWATDGLTNFQPTTENLRAHPEKSLVRSLKNLYTDLLSKTETERIAVADYHYKEVTTLMAALTNIRLPVFRSWLDRITPLLPRFSKKPSGTTTKFKLFIEGITYFYEPNKVSENIEPIYHRLMSCGSGDDAFRSTYLQCRHGMDSRARASVKKQIHTCYIERVIYDHLFRSENLLFPHGIQRDGYVNTVSHDHVHIYRLDQTARDFETCFPTLGVQVYVRYSGKIPVTLAISRSIKNRQVSLEVYYKTFNYDNPMVAYTYDYIVHCVRVTDTNFYQKRQMFTRPEAWSKSTADVVKASIAEWLPLLSRHDSYDLYEIPRPQKDNVIKRKRMSKTAVSLRTTTNYSDITPLFPWTDLSIYADKA